MIPQRIDHRFKLFLALTLGLLLSACQSPGTDTAMSNNDMSNNDSRLLAPCPSEPHCVSSLATDKDHYVAPLPSAGSREASLAMLKSILDQLPRVDYNTVGPARIHARFTSLIFRFVDDVTFYVHEDGKVDVRSSSRIGYYDFGVNRRRVEDLRQRMEKRIEQQQSAKGAGAT